MGMEGGGGMDSKLCLDAAQPYCDGRAAAQAGPPPGSTLGAYTWPSSSSRTPERHLAGDGGYLPGALR
jgi:hypothetical protein